MRCTKTKGYVLFQAAIWQLEGRNRIVESCALFGAAVRLKSTVKEGVILQGLDTALLSCCSLRCRKEYCFSGTLKFKVQSLNSQA